MDWFRSYHGAPSDTKLALIAIKSGQPRAFVTAVWWEVLDHASRTVTHGHARGDVSQIDPEIVAHQQGMTPDQVQAVLTAMADKGMLADGRVANWDRHQVKREDSQATERKQQQRERDRAAAVTAGAASRDVTHGHDASRPEERREEEKREEKKDDADASSGRGKRLLAFLKDDVALPEAFLFEATALGWTLDAACRAWTEFVDYWRAVPGQKGVKLDWLATWRNALKTIYAGREHGKSSTRNNRPIPRHTDFAAQDYRAGADGFVTD